MKQIAVMTNSSNNCSVNSLFTAAFSNVIHAGVQAFQIMEIMHAQYQP